MIELGGMAIEGPWDGEEAITLLPDLDAGATGSMTGGGYPDGIRAIFDPYHAGRREEAVAAYQRWLPLINYENRQCGLLTAKILMKEGGVIASEAGAAPPLASPPRDSGWTDRDCPAPRSHGATLGQVTRCIPQGGQVGRSASAGSAAGAVMDGLQGAQGVPLMRHASRIVGRRRSKGAPSRHDGGSLWASLW